MGVQTNLSLVIYFRQRFVRFLDFFVKIIRDVLANKIYLVMVFSLRCFVFSVLRPTHSFVSLLAVSR